MQDIEKALAHFKKVDPILHRAAKKVRHTLTSRPALKGKDRLFASLCESVVSQQLSVKASDTIWGRLKTICGGVVSPSSVRATSLPKLRKAGLSAAKAKTLKELAKAVEKGLDLPALKAKTPEEASEALVAVWGVGPWTVEMFLMFALAHPDIFSPRDLGLVRSMETLYGLKRNPSHKTLEKIALVWSPHRTLASRILWRMRDM
jgi:DNA-3-methyladenine glycosylase II